MSAGDFWPEVQAVGEEFERRAGAALEARWKAWKLDLAEAERHEVLGALLARQSTLASHLVLSPSMWTHDIGPVVLRAMADVHITVAWIILDPANRSRDFITHGVGQAKLELEQRKAWLATHPDADPSAQAYLEMLKAWVNSQRWEFLTEVNLGSWTGKPVREMAQEAGCLDFYEHVYQPFSAATHSTWPHLHRMNLRACRSVLHRRHLVPFVPSIEPHAMYPDLAAKYLDKTFTAFDAAMSLSVSAPAFRAYLDEEFRKLADSSEGEESNGSP